MKDQEDNLKSFNSILESLDAINESSAVDLYVPSLNKTVKFTPLTIKHQQDFNILEDELVRSGAEQLKYIRFCKAYDTVLTDTCLEDVNIDELLSIDRIALALQHRSQINKKMDVFTYDENETLVTIDIAKLVANIKKSPPKDLTRTLKHNSITVTTGFPSIKQDREINQIIERILNLEQEAVDSPEDVETIIENNFPDLLLAILGKHIIKIDVDDKSISIDSGASPDMLIAAIQKLPLSLLKKVNDSYDEYKEYEAKIVSSKHKISGTSTEVVLEIGTELFTGI
jgi:hypothetical protein